MLIKQLLHYGASIGALWLSLALPSTAQSLPATPPPSSVAPPAVIPAPLTTRQDTAAAVHELFRSRRGGGFAWLALGTAGMLGAILPAQQSTSAGVWTPGVVAGSALVGIGLNKRIQFRRSRERQVLHELVATGHLPVSVSRRLKGNFLPVPGNNTWPKLMKMDAVVSAPAPVAPTDSGVAAPALAPLPTVAGHTRADSLDAVLGLFVAKCAGGQLPALLLTSVGGIVAGTSNADNEYNVNTGRFEEREAPAGAVVAGLGLALGGLAYMYIHNAPYSMAKYEALKSAYEGGAPLPAALRASIKPKHFDQGRALRVKLTRKAARKNARRNS